MSQVKDLAEQVIGAVKSYIAQSVANLSTRLEEFDGRLKAIPDWADQLAALKTAVAEIPKPKDGEPGKDADPREVASIVIHGIDADEMLSSEAVKSLVDRIQQAITSDVTRGLPSVLELETKALVDKAIEALPKPTNGNDGRNAYEVSVSLGFEDDVYAWQESLRGEKGQSVTAEQVLPELLAELRKSIAAIPIPKDGEPGKDSTVTAENFRTLFETESTKALLDFERRAQDVLLKAIANIPAPKNGIDGDDGLGFEDLEVIHDGGRTFTFKFARGDKVKEFPFKVPVLIERGVYRPDDTFEKGDGVTFGGSYYIAQTDTSSKPGTDDTWRLAVKIGRQGKSAYDLARGSGFSGSEREWLETLKGEPGVPGKAGRDLTQMLHDGTKF